MGLVPLVEDRRARIGAHARAAQLVDRIAGHVLLLVARHVAEAGFAQHHLALLARIRHHAQFVVPEGDVEHQRSEEHTSELQSLMRISYAVFCLKTKKQKNKNYPIINDKTTLNSLSTLYQTTYKNTNKPHQ